MCARERQAVELQIRAYCSEKRLPDPGEIQWNPIPFAGEWGISTSFFQLAAREARAGKQVVVPQRAQEIATAIAGHLGLPAGFGRVEAVKGYLNLYFTPADFTQRVVDNVLAEGANFGRGVSQGDQGMGEFLRPNR